MIIKIQSRALIAIALVAALLTTTSMVVLAASSNNKATAELSVASGKVMVDGVAAISGATIMANSTISTADNSSATISFGNGARIVLSANSSLKLNFNETSISGQLTAGVARVTTTAGTSANISTNDGSVIADSSQAAAFTVNVECGNTLVTNQSGLVNLNANGASKQVSAGQDMTAGTAQPGTRCTRLQTQSSISPISGGALAGLLAAAGGAVAASIFALNDDNETVNAGGAVQVVSPSR
jgi:ferric-dicitrate binding protein FerR (iron transport regulator)